MSAVRSAVDFHSLGCHPLAAALLIINVLSLGVTVTAAAVVGPPVLWFSDPAKLLVLFVMSALWLSHVHKPGKAGEWIVTETIAAVVLVLLAGFWLGPGQYLVVSPERPLIDGTLAAIDRAMGIHVPTLAGWTADHPAVNIALYVAYVTLLPQFVAILPLVGIVLRDREALWEYVWNFHVCAALTLAVWAVFPAASAFQYFNFDATIDQTRFIGHFAQLRAGTFSAVDISDVEGLISMPSFHALGAFMVTWAARRSRGVLAVLLPVNSLLVAATFMSGAHYVVDVLGASVVFAVAVLTWRFIGARLLSARSDQVTGAQGAFPRLIRFATSRYAPGTPSGNCRNQEYAE